MEDKNNNSLIILILLIIVGVGAYFLFDHFNQKKPDESGEVNYGEYIPNPKKYEVNEYVKLSITDGEMAQIYLVDYQNYLRNNMEKAYELVAPEYANIRISSFEDFKKQVETKKLLTSVVKKYSVKTKGDYIYYIVMDNNNNTIVFKTNGVMQYSVYLDNETVVIDE